MKPVVLLAVGLANSARAIGVIPPWDPCKCASSTHRCQQLGVLARCGCTDHFGDGDKFCYVAEPEYCTSATASTWVAGAKWRDCQHSPPPPPPPPSSHLPLLAPSSALLPRRRLFQTHVCIANSSSVATSPASTAQLRIPRPLLLAPRGYGLGPTTGIVKAAGGASTAAQPSLTKTGIAASPMTTIAARTVSSSDSMPALGLSGMIYHAVRHATFCAAFRVRRRQRHLCHHHLRPCPLPPLPTSASMWRAATAQLPPQTGMLMFRYRRHSMSRSTVPTRCILGKRSASSPSPMETALRRPSWIRPSMARHLTHPSRAQFSCPEAQTAAPVLSMHSASTRPANLDGTPT